MNVISHLGLTESMKIPLLTKNFPKNCVLTKSACVLLGLLIIMTSFTPSFAINNFDKITIKDPRLENSIGIPIGNNVNVNIDLQISAQVVNNQDTSQVFTYIVQIKNESGVVQKITSSSSELVAYQESGISRSWLPEKPGSYTMEIFVWDSLINAIALSEQITLTAHVS